MDRLPVTHPLPFSFPDEIRVSPPVNGGCRGTSDETGSGIPPGIHVFRPNQAINGPFRRVRRKNAGTSGIEREEVIEPESGPDDLRMMPELRPAGSVRGWFSRLCVEPVGHGTFVLAGHRAGLLPLSGGKRRKTAGTDENDSTAELNIRISHASERSQREQAGNLPITYPPFPLPIPIFDNTQIQLTR